MKKIDVNNYIRKDIGKIESYVPGIYIADLARRFNAAAADVIKLNANENPYGPSPLAKKAVEKTPLEFYPGSDYTLLRQKLADYSQVAKESIIVGNGSDELIDLLLRLVLGPADSVITCPPTFTMYEIYAKLNAANVVNINRKSDFSIDVEKILKAINKKTKILFLCNPNNPTGTLIPLPEIKQLLETGILVVVDEAYFEFSKQTCASLLHTYPNLIILRTLSKWAGLAGLRTGYGLMNPFFVEQLLKIKPPFNVNVAAEAATIATLADSAFAKESIKKIISERKRVYEILQLMSGIHVYQSFGNFLFVQTKNNDYEALKKLFEKNRVALRYFQSDLLGNGIRITIGKPVQNDTVLKVFKQYYE